jgi:hypothetical protein
MIGRQKTSKPRAGETDSETSEGAWLRDHILPRKKPARPPQGAGSIRSNFLDLDGGSAAPLLDELVHALPDGLDLGRRVGRGVMVAPGQDLAKVGLSPGLLAPEQNVRNFADERKPSQQGPMVLPQQLLHLGLLALAHVKGDDHGLGIPGSARRQGAGRGRRERHEQNRRHLHGVLLSRSTGPSRQGLRRAKKRAGPKARPQPERRIVQNEIRAPKRTRRGLCSSKIWL